MLVRQPHSVLLVPQQEFIFKIITHAWVLISVANFNNDGYIVSVYRSGAITKLTIAMTLIKIFIDGPEVSLNGSPTVSPTTTAL